jgi:integrase
VTAQAAAILQQLVEVQRAKDKLSHGWRSLPAWLFYAEVEPAGEPLLPDGTLNPHGTLDAHNVRRAMRRVLVALHRADLQARRPTAACFPTHFTPHPLRHTYASLLIANGAAVTYVQQQLGHQDFSLTVNTYGSWLPHTGSDGSEILDDAAEI